MPEIILAIVMFSAGVAAGWLYCKSRFAAQCERCNDIQQLELRIKSLHRSCVELQKANNQLVNDRYYRRAQA